MVKPIVNEAVSAGGIVFTHTGEEKTNEATVILVGPGIKHKGITIPVDVQEGDKIIYDASTGIEVKLEGEKYLILKEENIICVYIDE
jgi:chaperonin GroES